MEQFGYKTHGTNSSLPSSSSMESSTNLLQHHNLSICGSRTALSKTYTANQLEPCTFRTLKCTLQEQTQTSVVKSSLDVENWQLSSFLSLAWIASCKLLPTLIEHCNKILPSTNRVSMLGQKGLDFCSL